MKRVMMGICAVAVLLSLFGCATKPPTFQSASFNPTAVDEIVVLSVIDARVDKKKHFKWDKMLPNPTKDKLKGKGYKARVVLDTNLVSGITPDAVEKADPQWIRNLGPADAHWLFVWSVTDVSHKVLTADSAAAAVLLGFWGPSGDAGMAAILFDKQSGTIAWRNDAHSHTTPVGGLIALPFAGLADNDAIESCFQQITAGIPKKEK